MLERIVNRFLIKQYYSVHIHQDKTETNYHVVLVKKDHTSINIIDQDSTNGFETLKRSLKKNIPVVLLITGSFVINKKVDKQPGYLEKVLFNRNSNEFYIFENEKDNSILLSISERKRIDKIIDEFTKENIFVVDFFISPYVILSLKQILPNINNVTTRNYIFDFNTLELRKNVNAEEREFNGIDIGEEKINNETIFSFASLLSYFFDIGVTNYQNLRDTFRKEFVYKKAFQVIGVFTLVFFLILLTLSYGIGNYYNQKTFALQEQISQNNGLLDKIERLKKDKQYKNNIISSSGLATKNYLSFYVWEISNSIPQDIQLEILEVFPVKRKVSDGEKINIAPNQIIVSGKTSNKNSVNDWIKKLRQLGWVSKTEISSYFLNKGDYFFTINIYL